MAKPRDPSDKPVSQKDVDDATKRFERSGLLTELNSLGVQLEKIPYVPTNFRSLDRIQARHANNTLDFNWTVIGREARQSKNNQTLGAERIFVREAEKLLSFMESSGHKARHYWCSKEWAAREESKAAVEVAGMAETISVYAGVGVDEPAGLEALRPHLYTVLEKWQALMRDGTFVQWEEKEQWLGKMNWNRNSAHPYNMPISEERFRQIDLPNFWSWLTRVANAKNQEMREAHLQTSPAAVPNANEDIYTMFMRPTDRVIHGVGLLWKGPGAFITKNTTSNLRSSRVAWKDIPTLADDASEALAREGAIITADDIRKYDRNFPRGLMNMVYEVVEDSGFMSSQPQYRQMILSLLYLFTRDAWLHVSATHRVLMVRGLPSGHPLTQWIGSLVHLAIYEYFTETHGLNVVWEQVLSDDGIRVLQGMTLDEAEKFVLEDMAEEIQQFGFSLHPEKTKVCDPHANVVSMGYRTDLDREVFAGDSTFFLKQMPCADAGGHYGNPFGAFNSLFQVERPASDEYREDVLPNLVGYDQTLGGRVPTINYEVARIVDVLASVGFGSPLYDDMINFVPNALPGWEKRGVSILEDKLSQAWRDGNIRYAGGTIDAGISRRKVVEDLLNWEDREPLWIEQPFR